jgi:transcriptional regulator with XRE-family HTH domain
MSAGSLVIRARKRAGITQTELARRCGTTQSAIARIESGSIATSHIRLASLIEACGLELDVRIVEPHDVDVAALRRNLGLSYDERVAKVVALANFVQAGRAARKASHSTSRQVRDDFEKP